MKGRNIMPIIWKVGLLLYEVALSIICQITPPNGITRVSYVHEVM